MVSFGGVNELVFLKSGKVIVKKLKIKNLKNLKKFINFFHGYTRNASQILSSQIKRQI